MTSVGNMLSKELNLKCNMVSTQLLAYVEHEHKKLHKNNMEKNILYADGTFEQGSTIRSLVNQLGM